MVRKVLKVKLGSSSFTVLNHNISPDVNLVLVSI